jgi:purine-binding chemotaxis protein CheW
MSSAAAVRSARAAPIDWDALRQRLDVARKTLERICAPGPQEAQAILRARARAFARAVEVPPAREDTIELIEFVLAYERYAIESTYVREVHALRELTRVPCTPAYVAGMVDVRGQILTVIDVRTFFDLPQKGLPDLNKVIVLKSGDIAFGLLADAIIGTRSIPAADLQMSLPTLTGIRRDYLRGLTAERIVVLDAGSLLSDPNLVVHEEVAPS